MTHKNKSNRQWYAKLSDFLFLHDFKQASTDHSLFLKFNELCCICR